MRENGADLNNEMLRHRYVVNTAVSSTRGLKFNEICGGKKKGWYLKVRHSVVVEGIFLFPVFLERKLIFENI